MNVGAEAGLSPLTRGNHRAGLVEHRLLGPIPAHAGQPGRSAPSARSAGAYPRSRGATAGRVLGDTSGLGLSPLTRGNRQRRPVPLRVIRPIPAHAGQPLCVRWWGTTAGAYPRSRGATRQGFASGAAVTGLSPLTRGNHLGRRRDVLGAGPIPAHAGQPLPASVGRTISRAYPRSRGATHAGLPHDGIAWGLSPLTRGNQVATEGACGASGPIPAHAGQPSTDLQVSRLRRAYPRSRGATVTVTWNATYQRGLSPLTRGNQAQHKERVMFKGPIPAHAGQPPANR